jgi:hypothetical protein
MPARITARVHITVSAHDVVQFLDAALVFLRVCSTIPLTLMYIFPDNAVQMPQTLQCCYKCTL